MGYHITLFIMRKHKELRQLHYFFIETFRPRGRITLRICKMPNNVGLYTYYSVDNSHHISLDKEGGFNFMIHKLIHEWGHLLQKDKYHMSEHGSDWGIQYARVYRAFLRYNM
jgi:hypothetical protein